jgi:aminopeptidase N
MRNLTEQEARGRAEVLEVASYDVTLDLTQGETAFGSTTVVRFTAAEGASTFLELDCLEVESATLDGRPISLQGNRFALEGLGGEHEVTVVAQCAYTRSGEGLHRFVDPADGRVYVYAQAFLDDAQRFFACFDQPDLKAVHRLRVTAPAGDLVLSNTRGTLQDGTYAFAQTLPLSTYHVTLAAGPWHGEQAWHDGIELGVWCRSSLAQHLEADELFEITRTCFDLQQQAFGSRYPFGDTYDQVFVPEFTAGAMENPGMVTFSDESFLYRSRATEGDRRLRAQVIAHELAHMWFGDLVTMRWWDGLWLNESFAEFMGLHTVEQGTRFDGAWSDFCLGRKAWGYRADQLPTTHPVAGDVPDNRAALLNFDGISYAKGASALRQLVAFVGEEAFFAGLRSYLAKHAFGNTDLGDLLAELETASGRELGGWARSWLTTSGVATLRPRFTADGLVVEQHGDVLRDHVIEVGVYDTVGAALRLRERVRVEVTGAETTVPEIGPADLVLLNDRDLTFAKIRFDDRSLRTVLDGLGRLEDPLARALCWGALWDAARDGELPARDHVAAVLRGVGAESDPALVAALLGQATRAAATFAPPQEQDALLAELADRCWTAEVAPGSDVQLVRVRAAVSTTVDTDLVSGLLTGAAVPEGLVVDADLRWHVVRRAAALGLLDEDAVERELAADHTASGELQAEAARAALPDAAVKARSWERLTGDQVTNAQVRAIGTGLWQRRQSDLLRPFVERYVETVPALSDAHSAQLAQSITQQAFPVTLVEPAVRDQVLVLLERSDLAAGLRRVVLEQHDDLRRALRAQDEARRLA